MGWMDDAIPADHDSASTESRPSWMDSAIPADHDSAPAPSFYSPSTFAHDLGNAMSPGIGGYLADKISDAIGPDPKGTAEAFGRGAAQGATLGLQPAASAHEESELASMDQLLGGRIAATGQGNSLLDKFHGLLMGLPPEQQKALADEYANKSEDDLKKTYVEQNQAAAAAHPGAYIGGQVVGSLPGALATGGVASDAAAAVGLGKVGTALLNGAGQAVGQGTLGAIQGYNANPLASDEDRLAAAKKAGLTNATLAGPLAAAAPFAPVATRTVGGALLGGAAANITNPLHPTLGKTLAGAAVGAGIANAAPALINKFGIANDLADANTFGKQGISLVNKGDVNRVQGQVADLAEQVSQSIGDLDKQVTAPAIQTIQDVHQGALEQLTKDLNATPEQAQQMIQNSQGQAINKLESLMAGAQQSGKTVSTGNVIDALTEQLKQDISNSGSVVGDVDRKTVQNAIDNLNTYMTKQGVPIDIKSSTILNQEGKPFLSNLSVGGKNLTADEVKTLINPQTGQIDPSKIQDLGGPNAQVNPISSSIKTTQMGGNNPQGQLVPNTSVPDQQQVPLGEITSQDLESGTGMQKAPTDTMETQYESPEGAAQPPTFTQIDSKQQVIPQEPQSGEMSVPEAQNLKRLMGKLGYDSNSIPDEVRGSFIAANQDLNKIITGAFEPSEPGAVNQYADANAKLTAIHDLGKLVGVPTKLYSTGEQIPSATLQNIVKGVGTSLTDADNSKFQQVVKLLSILDPDGAQSFSSNVQKLSGNLANLKSAGSNPLEQQAALTEQGLNTPESNQAAKNIQEMNTIKNAVGGPSKDVDAQGKPLPSDDTYKFIKNLGQAGPAENIRSEIDPALKTSVDNAIDLLRDKDPQLVNMLETQGKSVARQNELLENNAVNPKSLVGRTGYFIKQGLVRGSNLAGQVQAGIENTPIASPFFRALPSMIQNGAPFIAKYAPALVSAYQRGNSALTATNYSLSQSDPQYRMMQEEFNSRFK